MSSDFSSIPESVKLKNQISSKVSLQAKSKAKSSHSIVNVIIILTLLNRQL